MNEELKCFIVLVLLITYLAPFLVDLVRKQGDEDLPFEKLIVEVLQGMSIHLYALTAKFYEVFGVSKNNFDLVLRFFGKFMELLVIYGFLNFCEIKRLSIMDRLIIFFLNLWNRSTP